MTLERALFVVAAATVWSGCGDYADGDPEKEAGPRTAPSASHTAVPPEPAPAGGAGTQAPVGGAGAPAIPAPDEVDARCDRASPPCGGGVVGTWQGLNCPLQVVGDIDLLAFGLGCASASISSGFLQVSGTWTADALGTFVDRTTTRGVQEFEVPAACRDVGVLVLCERLATPLMTLGYASVECIDNPQTGGCTCTGTFDQHGGLAVVARDPLQEGSYSAEGTTLRAADAANDTSYGYCATGELLTLTPAVSGHVGTVVGGVVLEKL